MPAANAKDGMLDDIGAVAPEPSPEPASAAPEPAEPLSQEPEAPAGESGSDRPAKKPDTRPEGYVAKAERDRIANELAAERQARAAAEDRFAKMVDRYYKENAAAEPPVEPDYGPDPEQDPVGALKWQREQIKARAEAEKQAQTQSQERAQQEQGWQRALDEVGAYFAQAKVAKPELEDLYQGVRQSFAREYAAYAEASGRAINPAEVQRQVEQQEAQIIAWAYQNRVPIDAVIERMAAARGVTVKAPVAANGEQSAERPRDPVTGQFLPSEAEKAAKIATSQERNASLGAAPGAPVKKMTAAELAKMPEEEMWKHFDSIGRKPGAKNFDREMGFRS